MKKARGKIGLKPQFANYWLKFLSYAFSTSYAYGHKCGIILVIKVTCNKEP